MATRREPCPQESAPILVRPLRRTDLTSCCCIDRIATPEGARWDELRWYEYKDKYPVLVAAQGEAVAGFVVYEIRARGVELLKIAVHPHVWRSGVGSLLAQRMIATCIEHSRLFVQAVVPLELPYTGAMNFFKYLKWPGHMADDGGHVSFIRQIGTVEKHSSRNNSGTGK